MGGHIACPLVYNKIMKESFMHKENPTIDILFSAAFITATYFCLSYGLYVVASHLSLAGELISLRVIADFLYILAGVAVDRFTKKLGLRDRTISLAGLVLVAVLLYKFVL